VKQNLIKDTDLRFPHFLIYSASAGSGKTHTLVKRLLQLLLSSRVPNNKLTNILAITFTNNAANEMRRRVLQDLKALYFGSKDIVSEMQSIIENDISNLQERAEKLINTILDDYSSFQVQTIDSFITRIFKASALEFGFPPNTEIHTENNQILDAAFDEFARQIESSPQMQSLFEKTIDILVQTQTTTSSYIWDPYQKLKKEIRNFYSLLNAQSREITIEQEWEKRIGELKSQILYTAKEYVDSVRQSELEISKRFEKFIQCTENQNIDELIKCSFDKPVNKGKTKSIEKYNQWMQTFLPFQKKIQSLSSEYAWLKAHIYYQPFVEVYRLLKSTIETTMRQESKISLADISRLLRNNISKEILPQIYPYLGDQIYHYLIDEFQDTSPAQWQTLKPLLEEALGKDGSLFIVGDTKQSIFTFRQADWKIMKRLMEQVEFPSAPPKVIELHINHRSFEKVVDFGKKVFHEIVPKVIGGDAPKVSGLSTFQQEVKEEFKNKGYVEVTFAEQQEEHPEREKIINIINDCIKRGYNYKEITILASKNDEVIEISQWLSEANIKFISHSSLDIRKQPVTSDILSLIRFLDSPMDNLAFATFILSDTFKQITRKTENINLENDIVEFILETRSQESPLYTNFRKKFPTLWQKYFEALFNVVGYLPLYDLLSEIYKQFDLLNILRDQQAVLIKILEVIKSFEDLGINTIKDFLVFAEDEEQGSEWDIAIPKEENAVSIMTIHKAKGLGNRVVIVVLYDSRIPSRNKFVAESESGCYLLHLTKDYAELNNELSEFYYQMKLENDVDTLNRLYVAFTRAGEEMYIVSIKQKDNGIPSSLIPDKGYEPSTKPAVEKGKFPPETLAMLHHPVKRLPVEIRASQTLNLAERKRGEIIHKLLAKIEYIDVNAESLIDKIFAELEDALSEKEIEKMKTLLIEFINSETIRPIFSRQQGRKIMNEQEFVDSNGQLHRMDRVIIDNEEITVVDFKTGEYNEDYRQQINTYKEIIKNYYPGFKIKGLLAFIENKNVIEV